MNEHGGPLTSTERQRYWEAKGHLERSLEAKGQRLRVLERENATLKRENEQLTRDLKDCRAVKGKQLGMEF
jgi:hypothetical protein